MNEDELRLLMESLGAAILERRSDPTGAVAMLISETLKFRDKLMAETGVVLTVGDTRIALDALEVCLSGRPLPKGLTPEQRALTQIWIDRLTLFSR
ncbi:MAG TPA: hypothetical protein VN285_02965 [Candidatus Deferrimicrobium sp.]|nr:hypothetical protein [Candidatus Deferrimicrobium sp.]